MKRSIAGTAGASGRSKAGARTGKTASVFTAALLALATTTNPIAAQAAYGGGGGVHGGGFGRFHGGGFGGIHGGGFGGIHGGGLGGFHAGGLGAFHGGAPGGFHAGGLSGSGGHAVTPPSAGMDELHPGMRSGSDSRATVLRGGMQGGHWHQGWRNGRYGWWWGYDPYLWSDDDLYDGSYAYGQAYAPQVWYYCSDPAGYYPGVAECNFPWQTVPAG